PQQSVYPQQNTGPVYPPAMQMVQISSPYADHEVYMPMQPHILTVMVVGGFDTGSHFAAGSSVSIPPPPPGQAPNATQLTAMQGANVVMMQCKNNFFLGGSSGGYTIW
ncbi:DAZ-associated protein 2-like, partial [Fundulus diaphanus]